MELKALDPGISQTLDDVVRFGQRGNVELLTRLDLDTADWRSADP